MATIQNKYGSFGSDEEDTEKTLSKLLHDVNVTFSDSLTCSNVCMSCVKVTEQ